jgi:hypothetical protein
VLAVSGVVGGSEIAVELGASSAAVAKATAIATNVTSLGIGLVSDPGEVPDIPQVPVFNQFNGDDVGRGLRILVRDAIESLRSAAGDVPRQLTALAESLQPLRNSIARIESRLSELANAQSAYEAVEAELSGFLGRIAPALTPGDAEYMAWVVRYLPEARSWVHLRGEQPALRVFLDATLQTDSIGADTIEALGRDALQGLSRADRNNLLFRLVRNLDLLDPQSGRPALDVLRELRDLSSRYGRDALAADRTGPRLRLLLDELQLRLDPPTQLR